MRSMLRWMFVSLLFVVAPGAIAEDDHRTATVEVAVGAELEILPRAADLIIVPAVDGPDTTFEFLPETETATATRSATADALVPGQDPVEFPVPIELNTLYAGPTPRPRPATTARRRSPPPSRSSTS